MDSVTHLVAGALTPLAFRSAPKTRVTILFGIICGEFPDIDVIAGASAANILSFHRGPTHALMAQPLFALLLALIFHRLIKKGDTSGTWSFAKTWSVALLALLIHLFLDCMTTFGTQIFLPFSDFRVALPAMFIIDLAMTLPLIVVLVAILTKGGLSATAPAPEHTRVRLARGALIWLVTYPLLALCLNYGLAAHLAKEYARPGNPEGIARVELMPEPFAPLNWKMVGIAPDTFSMGRFFLLNPGGKISLTAHTRPGGLFTTARESIPLFPIFEAFTTYMTESVAQDGEYVVHTFADVRYETTLPDLLAALGRNDRVFLMQVRTRNNAIVGYRFLHRGNDAATTPWAAVSQEAANAG